jgi:hypothetical protein
MLAGRVALEAAAFEEARRGFRSCPYPFTEDAGCRRSATLLCCVGRAPHARHARIEAKRKYWRRISLYFSIES